MAYITTNRFYLGKCALTECITDPVGLQEVGDEFDSQIAWLKQQGIKFGIYSKNNAVDFFEHYGVGIHKNRVLVHDIWIDIEDNYSAFAFRMKFDASVEEILDWVT